MFCTMFMVYAELKPSEFLRSLEMNSRAVIKGSNPLKDFGYIAFAYSSFLALFMLQNPGIALSLHLGLLSVRHNTLFNQLFGAQYWGVSVSKPAQYQDL